MSQREDERRGKKTVCPVIRITLRDGDDDTVADTVFDFSGINPEHIASSGAKGKVSYPPTQHYRPIAELTDDPSGLIIRYVYVSFIRAMRARQ